MANILINGLNLSVGGGKNILENYLNELVKANHSHLYYVLTPDYSTYIHFSNDTIQIVDVKNFYKKNVFFMALYFIMFPSIIKKLKIDLVFNFGDVIIPTHIPQIYFFDWAYAIYPEKYIWKGMKLKDKLIRKTKIFLIDKYIEKVKLIICQTSNIENRLLQKYDINNLLIIPTPVGLDVSAAEDYCFDLPVNKKYFLYPAGYATHKNFQIIIKLGSLIKEKKMPFSIVLTIDKKMATDFLKKIEENYIDCIFNVGKIKSNMIPILYKKCDAMLFPSLLESYGLPYVEAMAFGKPILTSDLDFAHAICDDVAFYFDPFSAESILQTMMDYDKDKLVLEKKIILGNKKAASIPDWKEVFTKFEEQIGIILNQK